MKFFGISRQVDVVTTDNLYMLNVSKKYNLESLILPAIYPEHQNFDTEKWKKIEKIEIVWVKFRKPTLFTEYISSNKISAQ